MTYDKSKYYNLSEGLKQGVFSGGYVDNIDDFNMQANYSPYSRNIRLDGQSVIIRPGYQILTSDLTSGDYPRGIGSYLRADPANNTIVIRHNIDATHKLYTFNPTTLVLTSISTSTLIASNNRMRFYNVGDVVYCMNGSDDFGKLSGTTYTNPGKPAGFKPSFACIFSSKMVASGDSNNPNTVYFSVADDYEDFNGAGSDTGTFSEQVTGLASTGQALFYFTTNTISVTDRGDIVDIGGTLSYNSTPIQATEGLKYHDCIVPVGMNLYFLSTGKVISMISRNSNNGGFEVVGLSNRKYRGIEKLMQSLDDDQSNARGMYYPQDELIKRHLCSKGSTIPDVCVIYDVDKDAFLIDSGKYFYSGVYYNNQYIVTSAVANIVFRDEYTQDDMGSPIGFEYWTKRFYLSGGEFKNIIRESRTLVEINELAELTQSIRLDGKQKDTDTLDFNQILSGGIGTEEVGTYEIGTEGGESQEMYEHIRQRTKGNLNYPSKYIQRRRTNNTLAGKVKLKHVTPRLENKPPISIPL